jgi:hypothetical protein
VVAGGVVSVTVAVKNTDSPQTEADDDGATVVEVTSAAKASGAPMARLAARTTTAPEIRR